MILRGHRTAKMVIATLAELATMAHEAEENGDDLTHIGLMEELEARGAKTVEMFRQHYMAQWPVRHADQVSDSVKT